ncbi:tRNA 2-selenouridine(34) synthase MnmH [Bacillus daqingensis]|uniref:tRNA 2-selenouridine(34) synthase MnmH n=1 Tax=Bacillus daqingensis TaxID=872396 RepID=A0ABV9NTZ2_9BACI
MSTLELPSIQVTKMLEKNLPVVDVRSPGEFAHFSYPGSINLPLFTDEERVEVGTTYKQVDPERAKDIGITHFAEKLPEYYQTIKELTENGAKPVVIACARGGMRSGSFVSLFASLKLPVLQLEGGIRSIRRYVQVELERLSTLPWKAIVIGGYTGTRKTVWLEELQKKSWPVLNLEGLASHRGSIFGHIGLEKRSQKQFEWLLMKELQNLEHFPYMIMEAESKRIGPIVLPEWLQQIKEKGAYVELHDSMKNRVAYLLKEYKPTENAESFKQALDRLKKRLKPYSLEVIEAAEQKDDYAAIFEELLTSYYDPRYSHKQQEYTENERIYPVHIEDMTQEQILQAISEAVEEQADQLKT